MNYLKIIIFLLFAFSSFQKAKPQTKINKAYPNKKTLSIKGLEDWEFISENKMGIKFYFKNPIGRDNNTYTFWVLMFYSNPMYPSELYGSTHIEQVMVLNIITRKWYTKRIVIFDKKEKVMQIHDYLPDWEEIIPGSFTNKMLIHLLISKT